MKRQRALRRVGCGYYVTSNFPLRTITAVISYAGLVFVTMTCTDYLVLFLLTLAGRQLAERRPLFPSLYHRTRFLYVSRWSFLWLKYPSSYPDFNTFPFCMTTVTRPLNFSRASSASVAALNNSNSCTFRRNSMNEQDSESRSLTSMNSSSPVVPDTNLSLRQESKYVNHFISTSCDLHSCN